MCLARYRPIASLLLVAQVSGCTSWRPTTVSPRELIEEQRPSHIRVTRVDGERVELQAPDLRGDSLASSNPESRSTAVAISDIHSVEVRHYSFWKNYFLILSVVSAVAIPLSATVPLD